MAILSIHPFRFMILNQPYSYLYYNQLVGGLKGAYGNYETDYYYVSLKEGAEWLLNYLDEKKISGPVKVGSGFSAEWYFRNHPEIRNEYFRYEERSQYEWDYAIITNRYISPYQMKNKIWPPENAVKVIYADSIPVCAVLERKAKDDYYGYVSLENGHIKDAIRYFEKAIIRDDEDDMIYYNFARALYKNGQPEKADSLLKKSLKVNPDFEMALMYLGNIAAVQNRTNEAIDYYRKVIAKNRKYFEAYVKLSELLIDEDVMEARSLLRACLTMSPRYKPAIVALAGTYRRSDPEIAKKYDDLANTIEQNK